VWLFLKFWRSVLYLISHPALELGFHCVGFSGSLILFLNPFLWGKVRDLSANSLLSACYAGLLIGFQFCSIG
jgi:hypothetical protein